VSICTPHALHPPLAIEAAQAGKHILCEKPIALTVEDATPMIETAEAQGVKLFIAENFCYTPQADFLRHEMQKMIGELISATYSWGFRSEDFGYAGRRSWLTEPDAGGTGTWMLHGIHTMAQLRYVFGEVAEVYLREHRAPFFQRPELEGTMNGILTMASGISISIVQSCEIRFPHNLGGYIIHGERGSLRASNAGYELFTEDDESPQLKPYPPLQLSDYAREVEAFADYVAGDESAPTTGRSERRTLAIVQAGYESMKSGKPITLKDRFGEL
jgi:predicted dehydrogenase